MAKVKLDLGKLAKAGYSAAESVRIIQALEAARVQVHLQIQGSEGMKMLGQLPTRQEQPTRHPSAGMVRVWLLAVLVSLVSIAYGWIGLVQ